MGWVRQIKVVVVSVPDIPFTLVIVKVEAVCGGGSVRCTYEHLANGIARDRI